MARFGRTSWLPSPTTLSLASLRAGAARSVMWCSRTVRAASPATRLWTRPSTTGTDWRWRCGISRSRTSRCATRALTCRTADTTCKEESMLRVSLARLKQGHRTIPYPASVPALPDRWGGLPVVDASKCPDGCRACAEACPTDAINMDGGDFRLDLGRCLFCTEGVQACPEGALRYSQDYRLAVRTRNDLIYDGRTLKLAEPLDE